MTCARIPWLFVGSLTLFACSGGARAQTIIYVNAAANPSGDGSSWAHALGGPMALTAAIASARSVPATGRSIEIWVAAGVYIPDTSRNYAHFRLDNGIAILGGFAGGEASRVQRDPRAHEVILSGDLRGDDAQGQRSENSTIVVYAFTTDDSAVLDGVTVRAGFGGIMLDESSAVVRNCLVIDNRGSPGLRSRRRSTQATSRGLVSQCRILGNLGGGGVMLDGDPAFPGAVTIQDCVIAGNRLDGFNTRGAGVACSNGTNLEIRNCTIAYNVLAQNTGPAAGGVSIQDGGVIGVRNCIFVGNSRPAGPGDGADLHFLNSLGSASVVQNLLENPFSRPAGGGGWDVRGTLLATARFQQFAGPDLTIGTADDDPSLAPDEWNAVDRGVNDAAAGSESDVLGRVRIWDGDLDGAAVVDLGAAELGAPPGFGCDSCPGPRLWRAASGGLYDSPANWYPSIPSAGHDVWFDLPSPYTVAFPRGAALDVRSASIVRGAVSLALNGSSWRLDGQGLPGVIVGDMIEDPGAMPSLTASGGVLQAGGGILGASPGFPGAATFTGAGTLARFTDALSIGSFAPGRLQVAAGARLVSLTATVGEHAGAAGSSAEVTGQGSRWDVPFFLTISDGQVKVGAGAQLNAGFGIFMLQRGVLGGDGVINGDVVNFGSINPGSTIGTLTVNGGLTQIGVLPDLGASSGRLLCDIGGSPASGAFDRLTINGPAALGGLLQVQLGGYTPAEGDVYTLLNAAAGVEGRFDVGFFPSIGPDHYLFASYPEAGNSVVLSVLPLAGDPDLNPRATATVAGTPTAAALGDIDGDARPDLVITVTNGPEDIGGVVILRNLGGRADGWRGFSDSQVIQLNAGIDPRGVVLADLDRSPGSAGKLDIAVCNAGSNDVHIISNLGGQSFPTSSITAVGAAPVAIAAFSLDGDGAVDLATANHDGGSVSLLRGDGLGHVSSRQDNSDVPPDPDTIEPVNPTTDKPGTNAPHLVVGSLSGSNLTLLRNNGAGGMTALPSLAVGGGSVQILCRDLNGDGRGDLLAGNTDGSLSILLNNPADTTNPDGLNFLPAANLPIAPATMPGDGVISITAFRADADADRDIAVAVRSGGAASVRLLRNDLTGADLAFTPAQTYTDERAPIAVVSDYVDDDDRTVQDLVTVGDGGAGRPGGPFGPRGTALVRPRVAFTRCRADFNGDGFLDFFDYADFADCFEIALCPPGASADFNGDGFADFFDYDDFVAAFEAGC